MNAWLRAHADAGRDALRRLAASPVNLILSLLAIGIALALPAGGYLLLDNIQGVAGGLTQSHEISVFMSPDASRQDVAEIEKRLRGLVNGEVRAVPKDAALKRLQATEGLGDLLAGLAKNPLPDAFVVRPARAGADELAALGKSFAAWPKVAHVQLDSAWAKRLDALLRLGRLAIALFAAVLGAGLLAVVFNTIRLQVLARSDEVEVALLIGATPAFVARPFLWFGTLEGALGGAVALALVAAAAAQIAGPAGELVALYGGGFTLRILTPELGAAVILAGTLLGWTGAWLSTRRLAAVDRR